MPNNNDTVPSCPACGQPATQHTHRTLSARTTEQTGVCPRGHLWTAKVYHGGEEA